MTTTLQKWGNSLGVRIEKDLARKQGFAAGTQVKVVARKEGILIASVQHPKKTLSELVRGITPRTIHREADWGASEGIEVW